MVSQPKSTMLNYKIDGMTYIAPPSPDHCLIGQWSFNNSKKPPVNGFYLMGKEKDCVTSVRLLMAEILMSVNYESVAAAFAVVDLTTFFYRYSPQDAYDHLSVHITLGLPNDCSLEWNITNNRLEFYNPEHTLIDHMDAPKLSDIKACLAASQWTVAARLKARDGDFV